MKRYTCLAAMAAAGSLLMAAQMPPVSNSSLTAEPATSWLARAGRLSASSTPRGALAELWQAEATAAPGSLTPAGEAWLEALSLLQAGDPSARHALEAFIAVHPASPLSRRATVALAGLDADQGRWNDALTRLDAVGADNFAGPDLAAYRFTRARCLLMRGDRAGAVSLLADPEVEAQYGPAATFYRAYAAYADGDYSAARALFEQCPADGPAPASYAPYYLMQIAYRDRDYPRALDLAQQMTARQAAPGEEPWRAEAMRVAGESLHELGRDAEAVPLLWQYLSVVDAAEVSAPNTFYVLGLDEYRKGNIDGAVKLLQRAIPGADGAVAQSAYLHLGHAYAARGDNDQAMMAYGRAARMDFDPKVRETAYYNYAVATVNGGRVPFGSSLEMLEDFLHEFPASEYAPTVEEYIVSGFLSANDMERALAVIDASRNPSPALLAARQRALLTLGSRDLAAGSVTRARERLKAAADMGAMATDGGAAHRQARLWLAEADYRRGDADAAIAGYKAYLDAAPADDPDASLAWYGLGYALADKGRHADAARAFSTAIAKAPAEASAEYRADMLSRLGDVQYQRQLWPDAIDSYTRAYEAFTEAGDYPLYQRALAKGFAGRHREKTADIDLLLSQYPTTGLAPTALLEKAQSQLALGDNAGAVATYGRLIADYPATEPGRNGRLQLALAHLSAGRRQEALTTYRQVVEMYPSSPEARLALDDLGRLYAEDGRLDQMQAWLKTVDGAPSLTRDDMERLAWDAAESAYVRENNAALMSRYLADHPAGPNAAKAHAALAADAWSRDDYQTTISHAAKSLQLSPDGGLTAENALLLKARAEGASGRWGAAAESYAALEQRASTPEMLQDARLGLLYAADELGRNEQVLAVATSLLSTTAAGSDTRREAEFMQAKARLALNEVKAGRRQLAALAADPSTEIGARAAVTLADSYYNAGDYKQAISTLDALINANPPQPYWLARGFILYSDALRRDGRAFEADEYLRALEANYPGNDADIRQMIKNRLK